MIKLNHRERGVLIDALEIAIEHWKHYAKALKLREEPLNNEELETAASHESNAMYAEMLQTKLKDEQT